MSNLEAQDRKEEYHTPQLLRPTFSPWIVLFAMSTQAVLCGLTWTFVGLMIVGILPLPDNVASWIQRKPSDTNMLITVVSTVLGTIGSSLLSLTVRRALILRLPRGVPLSMMTAWAQLSENSLSLRTWHHPRWTLLSIMWFAATHFLTTAWSNLLTPVILVQEFPVAGRGLDLLSPTVADYALNHSEFPFIDPTTRNYSITPDNLGFLVNSTGYLAQAGISAASASFGSGPAFIAQYNSSTGGVNPTNLRYQLPDRPTLQEGYRGISTSYTLVQQGYTVNVSCIGASSPSIILNNSASVERTFQSPSSTFNYTIQTWSWNTNCSGNEEYYTGEVDIMTSDGPASPGPIGNGLFATSVCFYQNFSGPSNESFLVIMQSPSNSGYNTTYFSANPSLPIVCQFTPMITTVEVQYNQSGLVNVNRVLTQLLLPDESWPLSFTPAFAIWAAYLLGQGPYSNSFADFPLDVMQIMGFNGSATPVLEQYLRGAFEYLMRIVMVESLSTDGQALPENMTVQISGTMNVQTMGWRFHPRTQCVAVAVITLVAIVTVASGVLVLWEANYLKILPDTPPETGGPSAFNPTSFMDVLVASSIGSLGNALSQCQGEKDREKLTVEFGVTSEDRSVLNAS